MDAAALVMRYLTALAPEVYGRLSPWHLTALLGVLGLLAAVGLHHLLGHTFRFYRVRGGPSPWLAAPTLVVLAVSLEVLLVAYLLGTQADRLWALSVRQHDPGRVRAVMGGLLLEPVFVRDDLRARAREAGLTAAELRQALRAMPSDALRQAYQDRLQNLRARPAALAGAGAGATPDLPAAAGRDLEVLGEATLRWLSDGDQDWPGGLAATPAGPDGGAERPAPESEGPFLLSAFLERLVGEVQSDTELSRENWEHVVGTVFTEHVLRPHMTAGTAYLAIAAAALVLLANALYFYAAVRLRRWLRRRASRTDPAQAPPPATA